MNLPCFSRPLLLAVSAIALLIVPCRGKDEFESVEKYQKAARKFDNTLTVPVLPGTQKAIDKVVNKLIKKATRTGDSIAALKPAEISYDSTIGALDRLYHIVDMELSPVYIVENTSPEKDLRDSATEAVKRYEEFSVEFSFREDVYKSVRAFADTEPVLEGEQKKLLEDSMREYRRMGFELAPEKRKNVEKMQKELTALTSDFSKNIRDAKLPVKFTAEEVKGLPEDFLNQEGIKTDDDEYTLLANVTFHYMKVIELAELEETRKRMMTERSEMAMEENIPLLKKIVTLRDQIAAELGYDTWADYRVETRMAKNYKTVRDFLEELKTGLEPKWQAELENFRKMKAEHTGNTDATVNAWDIYFYREKYKKDSFNIDSEALRAYFPYEDCLKGMFKVYQLCFGIKIEQVENPAPWAEGVTLHVVSDEESGEPMGLFYLDMFPRDGKYNHFAQFTIIRGGRLPNGKYQRPTVALICNFPKPIGDTPSLLAPDEVETLFHEFGHVLHSILTRAEAAQFSGTAVPRDFVEAPSQMLEYWCRDKEVLDLFAADYRDPSKKIPQEVLDNMEAARLATIAGHYRRQVGYALTDMALHGAKEVPINEFDPAAATNAAMADAFLPAPEDTAFVAGFGHMMGYDAGYYGYAWADVIAADLASKFESSEKGYLDKELGRSLRKEIYEPGDSRDVTIGIEAFLERKRSMEPFLKRLGIGEQSKSE